MMPSVEPMVELTHINEYGKTVKIIYQKLKNDLYSLYARVDKPGEEPEKSDVINCEYNELGSIFNLLISQYH